MSRDTKELQMARALLRGAAASLQPKYPHGGDVIMSATTGREIGKAIDLVLDTPPALTPKAPPQTPPDTGIGSDGAGERD